MYRKWLRKINENTVWHEIILINNYLFKYIMTFVILSDLNVTIPFIANAIKMLSVITSKL